MFLPSRSATLIRAGIACFATTATTVAADAAAPAGRAGGVGSPVTPEPMHYGLMVDAGSSGSRLGVYAWPPGRVEDLQELLLTREEALLPGPLPTGIEWKDGRLFTEPGLSSYVARVHCPSAPLALEGADAHCAAGSASECWERLELLVHACVQASMEKAIPPGSRAHLFIRATGGMRRERSRDPVATAWLLGNLTSHLRRASSTGNGSMIPPLHSAAIISGAEEGFYAYLSVDSLLRRSGSQRMGVLDVGGATMQIAFPVDDDTLAAHPGSADYVQSLHLHGRRESVYVRSFDGCGGDAMVERAIHDVVQQHGASPEYPHPCFHKGFRGQQAGARGIHAGVDLERSLFVGTGDVEGCQALARRVLSAGTCAAPADLPPLPDAGARVLSSLPYTAVDLGILGRKEERSISAEELANATAVFCSLGFDDAVDFVISKKKAPRTPRQEQLARDLCFLGFYFTLLLRAFGLGGAGAAGSAEAVFGLTVAGQSADWTLGGILAAASEAEAAEGSWTTTMSAPQSADKHLEL